MLDYLNLDRRPVCAGMLLVYRASPGVAPNLAPEPFPTLGIVIPSGDFPTQYFGLRARGVASTLDLCLVVTADAPISMGGVITIDKSGTNYAIYLVEVGDSNASPVRVQTTTGIKSIRLKT